jgi:hypothetical protein
MCIRSVNEVELGTHSGAAPGGSLTVSAKKLNSQAFTFNCLTCT